MENKEMVVKYVCTQLCKELDLDRCKHCITKDVKLFQERFNGSCPVGNIPQWELIK